MYFIIDFLMNKVIGIGISSGEIVFYSAVLLVSTLVFVIIYLLVSFLFILLLKSTLEIIRKNEKNFFEFNLRREFAKALSLLFIATFLLVEIVFIRANYKGEGYYFYLNYIFICVAVVMAILKVYNYFWRRKNYLQNLILPSEPNKQEGN